MEKGLISVIMPTYKRGEMITEAINSVLTQTYENYEIVIVNDCSPDNTEDIIKKHYGSNPKVKYYRNSQNSGAGVSRKNGYLQSLGEYLVFMDDDDYYTDNNFFQKAIETFNKYNNELSFVSANSHIKYELTNEYELKPLNVKGKINNIDYLKNFQTQYMKPNSTFTTLFKREDIYQIDTVEMLNDSSIYMRALLKNPVYVLEDSIGVYRIHDKNMSFGIKLGFLLENLEEKKKIDTIIKQNNLMPGQEHWLYEQVMLTARYYVTGSKPEKEEFKQFLEWCKQNMGEDFEMANKELVNSWEQVKGETL